MKEQIDQVMDGLKSIHDNINDYENLKDQKEAVTAELEAAKKELAGVKNELRNANTGLSEVQTNNLRKLDSDINEKQRHLLDLQNQITKASQDLAQVNAKSRDAQAHYATVLAGIEALKARLDGRP